MVEIDRTADGRLGGRIRTDAWTPFSGVLELLKVLEEFVESNSSGSSAPGKTSKVKKGST